MGVRRGVACFFSVAGWPCVCQGEGACVGARRRGRLLLLGFVPMRVSGEGCRCIDLVFCWHMYQRNGIVASGKSSLAYPRGLCLQY